MKKSKLLYLFISAGSICSLSSCVDDKYDLSDIDTTTAIKINDLTVPVRLDAITLDNVLEVDDDGLIGIYTNAQGKQYYAIKQEGYFDAQPVKIGELVLKDYVSVPQLPLTLPTGVNTIKDKTVPFSYLINNVDPALVSLSYFGLNPNKQMEINLSVYPSTATLSNVEIQLPETYVASYNGETFSGGVVPVNIVNGKMDYPIYIVSMTFEGEELLIPENNSLNIKGNIGFKNATVSNGSDLTFDFSMSSFSVNVVSGEIDYNVELPEIQPVELNDLPDFLTEGETTLILENPQLYLNFSNLFGADYQTGLNIYPMGLGTEEILIPALTFQQSIVLAPDTKDLGLQIDAETTVLEDVPELSYILKGTGLPQSIQIEMTGTKLTGEIHNMVLGTDEGIDVSGGYTFFTPLAFSEGSQIIYQKAETDFFGDDVENVEVSHFRLQSDVTSQIPVDVELTLYPLDKDGNKIQGKNGYVSASSVVAYGTSKLDLNIDQPFNGLDGLEYEVKAYNMNGVSLSPDQTIKLDNIRATISGEYVTKF